VYTTSSAVSALPLWNLTPWRILNVHTSAVEFADQLSASTGFSTRVWVDRQRYSPVWASMSRPPWSATVSGLIAAAGTTMPALMGAPALPAALGLPDPDADVDVDVVDGDDPQAVRIASITGMEMPMTVPRRMNSRRESRPAANSSMTWLAISPWPRLKWEKKF